jgi:hypothetical protein
MTGGAQVNRQATDALLKANPQLSDLTHLSPGTVIVVPDLPQQTANSSEVLQPATLAPTDPVRLVGEQATAFGTALAAQITAATAQANATITLLKDPGLTTAAARDQTLAARLSAITNSTNVALREMQTQQAVIMQALAQLQDDLAKFTAPTLPGTPPPPPMTPPPRPGPTVPPITSARPDRASAPRAPRAPRKKK